MPKEFKQTYGDGEDIEFLDIDDQSAKRDSHKSVYSTSTHWLVRKGIAKNEITAHKLMTTVIFLLFALAAVFIYTGLKYQNYLENKAPDANNGYTVE